jgi:hypothetical protein
VGPWLERRLALTPGLFVMKKRPPERGRSSSELLQ